MEVRQKAMQAVENYLATPAGRNFVDEGRVLRVMMPHSGRYVYVSDNCKDLLGFEAKELIGQSAFDQVHVEDARHIRGILDTAVKHPTRSVFRTRHKEQDPVWIEAETRFHDGFVIAALKECDPPAAGPGWSVVDAA